MNMFKKIVVFIFAFVAFVMCTQMIVPAMAANDLGVTYTAMIDTPELTVSSESQTVTVTIKTNKNVDLDSITAQAVIPSGWSIQTITNSTFPGFGNGNINKANGMISWEYDYSEADYVTTDTLAVVTYTIPANAAAGEYKIDFIIKNISSDWGTTWEDGATVTTTLTIKEPAPAHTCTPEKVTGQAATCIADGWKDYYQCSDETCGKLYADAEGETEIIDFDAWKVAEGNKISATGTHTDATNDGNHICDTDGCNETVGTHKGGEATCIAQAVCTECGQSYGELAPNNHKNTYTADGFHPDSSDSAYHYQWLACSDCTNKTIEKVNRAKHDDQMGDHNHSCDACGQENITVCTPGEDDGDCTTAIKCTECDAVTTPAKEAHVAGEDDHNCTTAVKCVNCDRNAVEAKTHVDGDDKNHDCDNAGCTATNVDGGHYGGTATCQAAAVCDECGQSYGEKDASNHTSVEVTYKNVTATTHDEYHKCCDTLKTANVPHNFENAEHKCDCGKVETFTFTWIKENGDVVYAETVEYGKDAQSVPEVPYGKPGYTASWSHNGKGITEDTTITMVFTENTYRVEVYSANGNTLLEKRQHKYTTWISTNVTNFNGIPGTGTSLEGHGFVGFSLEPNGEKVCSTIIHRISVITDNAVYDAERGVYTVKLYVVIAPLQYYISYWVDGRIYASEAYEYGAAITPETRIPHKDQVGCSVYTFAGWDKEIPETMPAGNVEIHATFTETKNHTGKPVYTNNGDTHSATYDCCDGAYVTDEAHDYNTGDADYTCTCGATFTGWEGKTYYQNAVMVTGWTKIDGAWYYLDTETGVRAEGITRVPYPTVEINGITYGPNPEDVAYYEAHKDTSKYSDLETAVFYFDENGKFVQCTGIEGKSYFINGMAPWHVGMVQIGSDYYYFAGDKSDAKMGNVMATDKVYATRDFNSGLTMNGTVYYFGDNGKLIVENGIQKIGNDYFYYENGVLAKGKGVVKMTDKDGTFYIYVRSNGQLATGKYWPTTRNGYLERGEYDWGTDGKYYPSTEVLDGIVADGGNFYYYVNGKKQIGLGVVELIDEEGETFYIYVRSNGQLATGKYWPTTRNDYLERGEYDWGTDGKYYPAK